MGIAPYKTFTFDGESSADYGVYITGEGVFNAPERAVEMVDIPGRNGSYALDQGRFGNIEVTYTAGMVDDSETDFADRLADVRNWLCSKKGYVRLEDEYNPDEYRMAVYSSGISVEHADLKTGEFEISFDCKPQRWLTSGETATAVANNGTLTNPTRFDAEPLLEVKGYGGIEFNGYSIDIENVLLGDVVLVDDISGNAVYYVDTNTFNNGDTITVRAKYEAPLIARPYISGSFELKSLTDSNSSFVTTATSPMTGTAESNKLSANAETNATVTFTAGTDSTKTNTLTITYGNSGNTKTVTYTITQKIQYTASMGKLSITVTYSASGTGGMTGSAPGNTFTTFAVVDSTVSALGNPTYIDCEIGEAYMLKGGNIVSCNSAVALGSDLPKLAPGANTITFDNTVTELKIHPRWWRV